MRTTLKGKMCICQYISTSGTHCYSCLSN